MPSPTSGAQLGVSVDKDESERKGCAIANASTSVHPHTSGSQLLTMSGEKGKGGAVRGCSRRTRANAKHARTGLNDDAVAVEEQSESRVGGVGGCSAQ